MQSEIFRSGLDVAYLASCALWSVVPSADEIKNIDFERLYRQASRQSMQSIVYLALKSYTEKYGDIPDALDSETYKKLERDYALHTRRAFYFDLEREKILSFMESEGIWYLPLKGIIMQNYYPQIGMRQMADNDIHFDINHRKKLRDYMLANGYTAVSYGKGVHDTYTKPPFYNFEMHAYLYRESVNSIFDTYYKSVKDRIIKDESNSYGYHFSDEDFYIHTLTHIYKHYDRSGIGIRFLMDVYVYLKSKSDTLDWEYCSSELMKLGLEDFEKKVKTLSLSLFGDPSINLKNNITSLNEEEIKELEYFIVSGIYGTKKNAVNRDVEKITGEREKTFSVKIKYLFRRLFPSMLYYKENYPFLYKYKIFIPFFIVYRMIFKAFRSRKNVVSEMKFLNE